MDSQFSFDNIETLVEERPVIARLLVGTIGATAALMAIGIHWAAADSSVVMSSISHASPLALHVVSTIDGVLANLPHRCHFGPGIADVQWSVVRGAPRTNSHNFSEHSNPNNGAKRWLDIGKIRTKPSKIGDTSSETVICLTMLVVHF